MQCPLCNSRANCIDTRSSGQVTHRKRRCFICHHVFSTVEFEEKPVTVTGTVAVTTKFTYIPGEATLRVPQTGEATHVVTEPNRRLR